MLSLKQFGFIVLVAILTACGGKEPAATDTAKPAKSDTPARKLSGAPLQAKNYYVAVNGNDSNNGLSLASPFKTIAKAVNMANPGDVIDVRAGTYTESVVVNRPGSASASIILRGYSGDTRPVLKSSGTRPTLWFYTDACDEDTINQLPDKSGNSNCQSMYWEVRNLEIQGSPSGDGDGNVVKIDTPNIKLINNRLCYSRVDVVKIVRTANDVEILDNEICQNSAIIAPAGGSGNTNAQAVDIVGADRVRVAGNYVHDMADIGIYAKGNSRNTIFENNYLVNIGNHAIMVGQETDADRMLDGSYETYDAVVRNNVVLGSGWACVAVSSSFNAKVYNNSCYNTAKTGHGSLFLSNEAENQQGNTQVEIVNNIIYGSAKRPVIKIDNVSGRPSMTDFKTLNVDRNLYFIAGGIPKFLSTLHSLNNGNFNAWKTAYTKMSARSDTSLVADPQYASVSNGSAALTLKATSPAIDRGIATGLVLLDKLGVARPQGGAIDLGAYETLSNSTTYFALSVSKSGSGTGSVSSNPASINCGSVCAANFAAGASVTLSALADSTSNFNGWSGACTGMASCTVTMSQAQNINARFDVIADTTPPTLSASVPANGASNIAISSVITLTFSENLNCATVTNSAFSLSAANSVNGTLACTNNSLSFTPTAAMAYATLYTISANANIKDLAGNALSPVSRSFTTENAPPPDTTKPSVITTRPAAGETGVAVNGSISVTFSEAINCASISNASFVVNGASAVAGTLACPSPTTATFTANAALANTSVYTVQLSSNITDLAGNALPATAWNFTTADAGSGAKFSFMVYGDSRAAGLTTQRDVCQDNATHMNLVSRMATEPNTSFVAHLGDMVAGFVGHTTNWLSRGECPNNASKGSLKELIAPLQNKTPAAGLQTFYFPVVGNHDDAWTDNSGYPDMYGNGFCDVFDPKKLGSVNHTQQSYFQDTSHTDLRYTNAEFERRMCSKVLAERGVYPDYMYYSFDVQGSHFIVLRLNSDYYDLLENNSCSTQPGSNYDCWYYKHQLDWLRYDLAKARANSPDGNIFVFLHAPLVTSGEHAANASAPTLLPEFSKYKVKMVFSGHNHTYERSYPVYATASTPTGVRDDVNGTVYMVSGGGGSSLTGFRAIDPRTAVAKSVYHYLRVDVDGSKVTTTAIGLDGNVLDVGTRQ